MAASHVYRNPGILPTGQWRPTTNPLPEYLKERMFHSSDLHHYFTWVMFTANLVKPSNKQVQKMENTIREGDRKLAAYFNQRLLILPVYHCAAPAHGQVIKELFSYLELPPLSTFYSLC